MDQTLTYFLYNEIPASKWHGWTLAVLAQGRKDADKYIHTVEHGGKFVGQVASGIVKADCGAVTEAAQRILHQKAG
jgi:hypothetical protein